MTTRSSYKLTYIVDIVKACSYKAALENERSSRQLQQSLNSLLINPLRAPQGKGNQSSVNSCVGGLFLPIRCGGEPPRSAVTARRWKESFLHPTEEKYKTPENPSNHLPDNEQLLESGARAFDGFH